MPRRSLYAILIVTAVSLLCYQKADSAHRRRYGRMFTTFTDILDEVESKYVEEVDERELFEGALSGMVSQLDDYSAYINPQAYEELEETLEQKFGGIGIQVSFDELKVLTVMSPLVGTPAYTAGIRAGDKILEIEGESTEGFTMQDAVNRLRGEPGEKVQLKVLHQGDTEPVEFEIARAIISVESVLGDTRKEDGSWDFMLQGTSGIGYARINSFSEKTTTELKAALDSLSAQGMRGLILDLRNNPGGLLESAVEICDLFVDRGTIVTTRGRGGKELQAFRATTSGGYEDFPMVVLVNRYSASASEIVAACLQDHKRATIVGQRTWGKGSVQEVFLLEGGKSALKLTMASYWRPSGKNIHRTRKSTEQDEWGVRPNEGFVIPLEGEDFEKWIVDRRDRDVLKSGQTVSPAETGTAKRFDPQLDRALEALRQQLDDMPAQAAAA